MIKAAIDLISLWLIPAIILIVLVWGIAKKIPVYRKKISDISEKYFRYTGKIFSIYRKFCSDIPENFWPSFGTKNRLYKPCEADFA